MNKYNMPINVSGVYLITCKANNKKYVGASVDVYRRCCNHMNRDSKLYPHRDFYKDVLKHGHIGFTFELLEQCDREDLLANEQKWFDRIKPEYNLIRPCECGFENEHVKKIAKERSNSPEAIIKRKDLYNTPEYLELFRHIHPNMRKVNMYKDGVLVGEFVSIRAAARWLDENTKYKAKNKASKVKAVCDGERKNAFGYQFRYSDESVETSRKA